MIDIVVQRATHAVGIVFRSRGKTVEYLLVRPRNGANEWVLPKGHIEKGEREDEAVVREVREEAGVVARVVDVVEEDVRFQAQGEEINAKFYLMEYQGEGEPDEIRQVNWFQLEEALKRLEFPESKNALRVADEKRIAASEGTR